MKKVGTLSLLFIGVVFGAGAGSALEPARELPAHALSAPDTASRAL